MNKFEPATLNLPAKRQFVRNMARDLGISSKAAADQYERLLKDEVWVNDTYQVNINRRPEENGFDMPVWHVSIKRRDKQPIHDWRDLQEIKNMLVGEEIEAIEIYPAESRKVDTANQYHLWCFPNGSRVPVGWTVRLVDYESKFGAVQRAKEA